MQDPIRQVDKNPLHRTAGPYIGDTRLLVRHNELIQITPTMLVNKSFERSFPTSLVNGWNNCNGVVGTGFI
jgi:hypothetical protein